MRPRPRGCAPRGFTLIELMVALVLLGLLLKLGLPSFMAMIANTQVRTVADALQNGIRTARSEALRDNQSTVFVLTNGTPALNVAAVANGTNWWVQTIARPAGDAASAVQGGALGDVASGVAISGPASICFNSNGRLYANTNPGPPGASCTVASPAPVYLVSKTGADHPLKVTVAVGGQVRLCDPARTLSAATPDGCPSP